MNKILDVEIPLCPPTVNTYWRANGNRRFITPKGVAFKRDMQLFIKPLMTQKRLSIEVELSYPDRRVRDLDNSLKALLDSLVSSGLCLDDSQFDQILIRRGSVIKGGLMKIIVHELD